MVCSRYFTWGSEGRPRWLGPGSDLTEMPCSGGLVQDVHLTRVFAATNIKSLGHILDIYKNKIINMNSFSFIYTFTVRVECREKSQYLLIVK